MICKNPECNKEIEIFKSAKRLYCDDRCKNRASFLRRKRDWKVVNDTNKILSKNYRIIKDLKSQELGAIKKQTLKSHGFNFNYLLKDKIIKSKGQDIHLSSLYDIYFTINDDNELVFYTKK